LIEILDLSSLIESNNHFIAKKNHLLIGIKTGIMFEYFQYLVVLASIFVCRFAKKSKRSRKAGFFPFQTAAFKTKLTIFFALLFLPSFIKAPTKYS